VPTKLQCINSCKNIIVNILAGSVTSEVIASAGVTVLDLASDEQKINGHTKISKEAASRLQNFLINTFVVWRL
jgi:hypothetical protein